MSVALQRDIGKYTVGAVGRIPETITAGAGNDGVEVDGPWIDLEGFDKGPPESCKVVILYSATLAEDETLTLAANAQDATDTGGTGAADYGRTDPLESLASGVVATGGTGGSTETGVAGFDLRLDDARNALRIQSTADLSAANTDTVDIAVAVIFGGFKELPAS